VSTPIDPPPQARVLIVEDDVIVAEDLRQAVVASGFDVVAHAIDGHEAVQMARHLLPDVVLMDVYLDGPTSGIDAARAIQWEIDTSIIYVSASCDDAVLSDAVSSGAFGYIVKPFQSRQVAFSIKIALQRRHEARVLEERVRLVASTLPVDGSDSGRSRDGGEESVNAGVRTGLSEMVLRVQALLVDEHVWTDHTTDGSAPPVALGVTPREKEIIRGLICYRRLSKVAEVLGISVHTARNHLKSVFRKLDVHSQDDLIRFLLEGR